VPKIFIQLSGGLGNQMFQYAAGRGVAEKLGAELVLDSWSGFVRDREYRRSYELGAFRIKARKAKAWERWPVWLQRTEQKMRGNSPGSPPNGLIKIRRPYGKFLLDDNRAFYPKVFEPNEIDTWMIGCFQSPQYFEFISEKIREELTPPIPSDPRFRVLGERLRSQPTVAVGIRLYEEAKDPAAHSLGRSEKTMGEIKQALEKLRQRHPDLKVALFCTHRARVLEELGLPHDVVFVTHEEGFQGSISRLWLLTQCRHHLFNNSSFYWWGAYLSEIHHQESKGKKEILAANQFYNQDSYLKKWKTF